MGLETGLCRMKKGERAELTMEPKYGFGKAGLKSKVGIFTGDQPDLRLVWFIEALINDFLASGPGLRGS